MSERPPCSRCHGTGTHKPVGLGMPVTCGTCGGTGIKPAKKPTRKPISTTPASKPQRAQVAGQACRGCGRVASRYRAVDPAHVVDRAQGGCDSDLCVVPLCRTTTGGCHRLYDEGHLDLLPRLAHDEQAHAVSHLGILGALRRTTGDRYEPVRGQHAA